MSTSLKSISALAKSSGITSKELFRVFCDNNFIVRAEEKWMLTDAGIANGGTNMISPRYGEYIAFPGDILDKLSQTPANFYSATKIGETLNISPQNINAVLSELGWISRGQIKGWTVSKAGEKLGAVQKIYDKTGVPYVLWPESIIENKTFRQSIQEYKGESASITSADESKDSTSFREKFEPTHRAQDGHFVRSRAEIIIDNWLYMAEIAHAYERKLPIAENAYCDFYLPTGKVYIEFWGLESNPQYAARKQTKIDIYKTYGFNLIELKDADIQNLDDVLPGLLLPFGIKSY